MQHGPASTGLKQLLRHLQRDDWRATTLRHAQLAATTGQEDTILAPPAETWLRLGTSHLLGAAVRGILRLAVLHSCKGSLGAPPVMVGRHTHLQNTWLPLATDHLLCTAVPAILRPLQLAQAAQAPYPAPTTYVHWLTADRCGLVAAHLQDFVIAAAWHGSRLPASGCLN